MTMTMTTDRCSHSRPEEALVTHLDWSVRVDFEERRLTGTATYSVRRLTPGASELNLDTANLEIRSVVGVVDIVVVGAKGAHDDNSNNNSTTTTTNALPYTLHPLDRARPHLGRRLEISLFPDNADGGGGSTTTTNPDGVVTIITVEYNTTDASSAVQWLPPSQTAGKRRPYLFTQCQAIHARSLVPCQDRCGVKMTYTARCVVPAWSTCVMSAVLVGTTTKEEEADDSGGANKIYTWDQPVPISSYLLALAVGELERRDLSPRCAVWAEPSVVDQAAYEFAETDDFLSAAEHISGRSYVWGRYDILCLPPSFPFGGMENPCLTFVTPTLLAGDRSLADVIAHEIAQ